MTGSCFRMGLEEHLHTSFCVSSIWVILTNLYAWPGLLCTCTADAGDLFLLSFTRCYKVILYIHTIYPI